MTEISLEELMNVEVVSVSKKQQRLTEVAAAVHVLTQEDLRRSGATSIAEALRMVPGMQVARIDANKWAISVRGFNGRLAWKPSPRLEFSFGAQNLLDPKHAEFISPEALLVPGSQVRRGVYGRLTWRY